MSRETNLPPWSTRIVFGQPASVSVLQDPVVQPMGSLHRRGYRRLILSPLMSCRTFVAGQRTAGVEPPRLYRRVICSTTRHSYQCVQACIERVLCFGGGMYPPKALRPVWNRKLVDGLLVDWGVSIRRACEALRFDTSSYHYKSRRTGQACLELRIREICETRVRYGYRRGRGGTDFLAGTVRCCPGLRPHCPIGV